MYLLLKNDYHQKLIKFIEEFYDEVHAEPPKIPCRLAKLLSEVKVLSDHGFDDNHF